MKSKTFAFKTDLILAIPNNVNSKDDAGQNNSSALMIPSFVTNDTKILNRANIHLRVKNRV